MFVPFEKLGEESRIWVHLSSRPFTFEEANELQNKLEEFLENWTAHKKDLLAGFYLESNQALIIGVDESLNPSSGCSIDKLVNFLLSIEKEYNISLFDRLLFAWVNENNEMKVASKDFFQSQVDMGNIHENTLVYNTLINAMKQMKSQWKIPFHQSWHKRLFQLPIKN